MKVLITNPPWLYRKGLSLRFGVRAGSRWPFSYEIPTFYNQFSSLLKLLKEKKFKDIYFRVKTKLKKEKEVALKRPCPIYVPYPIFMGYATSYLISKGIDAIFYDAAAEFHNYQTFFKKVKRINPDIIIQETSSASFNLDLEIAKKLHEKYEVCLVGPQATAWAEKIINLPYVDYVLKGAYEYSALEMVRTRRKGIYEYNVADLDDLVYPYRDKKIIWHYRDFNCLKKLSFPQLWVYASRGCIFRCDFCLWVNVMYKHKLSLRKPQNIIDEIDNMVSKYNFKHIYFDDDCFNIGPEERLREIADGLNKIGLPWTINARLDLCDKEMFRYFVERGCVGLRLGVESLSQRFLDLINKDLKVEEIIDKIKFLEKLDVDLYLLFMHYVPGETEEDRKIQEAEIKKLGHRFQNPPCIPYPGTPYYQKIIQSGFNLEELNFEEFDAGNLGNNLINVIKKFTQHLNQREFKDNAKTQS